MVNQYICSQCGMQTVEVYHSLKDSGSNDMFSLPENFQELEEGEQEIILDRHKHLLELLEKIHYNKRLRILQAVENNTPIILLVCPNCRKIYDSREIGRDERLSHANNSVPLRKPKKIVVSDDIESITEATQDEFEDTGRQSIFVYGHASQENFYENKKQLSDSKFADTENLDFNVPYLAREINNLNERSDKTITGVKIIK